MSEAERRLLLKIAAILDNSDLVGGSDYEIVKLIKKIEEENVKAIRSGEQV